MTHNNIANLPILRYMVCLVLLMRTVLDLAAELEIVTFSSTQVVAAHRLPVRSAILAPILVRFTSMARRDEWLVARGKLRHLIQMYKLPQIYLAENLMKANGELFCMTRNRARETNYKFVWVKNGRIYVRKKEGDWCFRIATASDLSLIISNLPCVVF